MRFLKALLPVLVFGILAFAPQAAFAADANFFGPIIPVECHCVGSAPDFSCVLATIQNAVNLAISVGVIIFVLVCAYAGFLFMFSSVNAENKSKAKNVLTNAVVGLLLALSAWLLVDFMMKTLYNPATQDQSGKVWGPWNSILGDGTRPDGTPSYCLVTHTPPAASTEPTVLSEAEVRAQVEATVSAMLRSCVSTLTDAQNTCLLSARNETNVRTCVPGITATQLTCITNGIMSIASGGTGVTTGTPSTPTTPTTPGRLAVGSRVECTLTTSARYPGTITAIKNSGLTYTIDFDLEETGDVPASQCRALTTTPTVSSCPIPALTPLTDALALRMEAGETVIWGGTDPRLQTCANRFIAAVPGGGRINSAFRPAPYQTHLWELRDRWCTQGLSSNTASACSALKSSVGADISRHGLSSCGAVGRTSRHTAGTGVDIRLNSGDYSGTVPLARESCLDWKNYPGDPYHYDLLDGCSCN